MFCACERDSVVEVNKNKRDEFTYETKLAMERTMVSIFSSKGADQTKNCEILLSREFERHTVAKYLD